MKGKSEDVQAFSLSRGRTEMRCGLGAVHAASEQLLLHLFFASTTSSFYFFSTAVLLSCGLSGPQPPIGHTNTNTHRQALFSDSNFTSSLVCLTHSLHFPQSPPPCGLLCHHFAFCHFFFSSPSRSRFRRDKCHVMLYGYITSVSSVWLCVCVCV